MAPAGRRPGPNTTSAAILTSARTLFAQLGYRATTMRAVADRAEVNQALIRHFYGSKEQLFMAALQFPAAAIHQILTTLRESPRDELGARIVGAFVEIWRDPATSEQLQAFFRAAATSDEGSTMARRLAEDFALPQVVSVLGIEPVRVAAIMAQLLGYAFVAVIVKAGPLSSATEDEVVALLGPTVQAYLDG